MVPPPPLPPPSLQSEATLHLVCDHFADGERGGGRGGGSVAHVENATADLPDPAVEDKVVHQVPASVQRLSSDPRRTPAGEPGAEGLTIGNSLIPNESQTQSADASPQDVACGDFRNVLLQEFDLGAGENPPVHFSNPVGYVPQDQLLKAPGREGGEPSASALLTEKEPGPPEGQGVDEVAGVEVVEPVALPFEGQDGVGAQPDASIHPRGEMNSEEREPWVGNLAREEQKRVYGASVPLKPTPGGRGLGSCTIPPADGKTTPQNDH